MGTREGDPGLLVMLGRRGDTPDQLAEALVAVGATAETAHAIMQALADAGLSAAEARDWLGHPNRAYPHPWPMDMLGQTLSLQAGSIWLIEKGHADRVLAGAQEFAAAGADERTIARLFGGNVQDARGLTGGEPARAAVIVEIARAIEAEVRVPENVCYVGQTRLPGQGGTRIVDRLMAGDENAVRDELARGDIDPSRLLESGDLILTGW